MQAVHVQTLLPSETHRELRLLSIREAVTVKKLVRTAIEDLLTRNTYKGDSNGESKKID